MNKISHVFDIKGSTINRKILPANAPSLRKMALDRLCREKVIKDQDLLYILNFKTPDLINLSIQDRRKMMQVIRADTELLRSFNIMDYSLLIAVEQLPSSSYLFDHYPSVTSSNFIDFMQSTNQEEESLDLEKSLIRISDKD